MILIWQFPHLQKSEKKSGGDYIKTLKSEKVDLIISTLEERMLFTNKHLIKTDTIFNMCQNHISLSDSSEEREQLLEIGIRQVIQSRLYAHGYFSVETGYFVNLVSCENIGYLNLMLKNKDKTIEQKVAVRNKIKELKALDGQMKLVPDENGILTPIETKTKEEVLSDLEADAV